MNHSDIKLVIDQLHGMELTPSTNEVIIFNAVNALETLGNQVAKQATALREAKEALCLPCDRWNKTQFQIVNKAIATIEATSTDSTQILQEWLDEKLGEPVAYLIEQQGLRDKFFMVATKEQADGWDNSFPVFKKPELSK